MRFSSNRISFVGHLLGLGGLVPFIGLAALSFTVSPAQRPAVIFSLLAYSATIISFLGAIHWGLTMVENLPSTQQLVWGVVPSLLAWISLMVQGEWGLLLVAAVLFGCLVIDAKIYPSFGLQHWLSLRWTLTVVAIVSVALPALHGLGLLG
jgi:hypothetical protein